MYSWIPSTIAVPIFPSRIARPGRRSCRRHSAERCCSCPHTCLRRRFTRWGSHTTRPCTIHLQRRPYRRLRTWSASADTPSRPAAAPPLLRWRRICAPPFGRRSVAHGRPDTWLSVATFPTSCKYGRRAHVRQVEILTRRSVRSRPNGHPCARMRRRSRFACRVAVRLQCYLISRRLDGAVRVKVPSGNENGSKGRESMLHLPPRVVDDRSTVRASGLRFRTVETPAALTVTQGSGRCGLDVDGCRRGSNDGRLGDATRRDAAREENLVIESTSFGIRSCWVPRAQYTRLSCARLNPLRMCGCRH